MAEEKKQHNQQEESEVLVRIFGYDIKGSVKVPTALTKIKGVSWTISRATCLGLKIPSDKKVAELSKADIKQIEDFLKNLSLAPYLLNRRSDPETGEETHLFGNDLEMQIEFDIKRLKKMKSYKGIRHTSRLPVRGQRTRSNFRKKGAKSVGVKRKK